MPTKRKPTNQPAASAAAPTPVRRLRRPERREQLLAAATRAFARAGFAATSLDDIAQEAAISRVLLYRHFDSKTDLYRAMLDRGPGRVSAAVPPCRQGAGVPPPDGPVPQGHGRHRPPGAGQGDRRSGLGAVGPPAQLAPMVAIEAVIAWLDAGQPDPDQAADRIRQALTGVISAAQQP